MTNRKSKTIRKIGPASTSAILPSPTGTRPCPTRAKNGTPKHSPAQSESRITHNASRVESRNTEHATSPPINPPIHQSNTPFPTRTRNGKIARLPCEARDMVNRMLRNNIPHSQIVGALEELNFKVTARNISNWKTRGGYRDWCLAQDRALETRLLQDNLLAQLRTNDASQLAEVGLQLVATELSQFFLKPETRAQLNTEPEKLARTIGILCRLARQIHLLQKHRDQSAKELGEEHHPELVKRETDETIETVRDIYSANKPCESADDQIVSHRNFLPKNGFRADPPEDDPEDDSHIEHNIKLFEAAIAARNAQYESQCSHQTSAPRSAAPGSAAPASAARAATDNSVAEAEHLDHATSEPSLPCGAQPIVSKATARVATQSASVPHRLSEKAQVNSKLWPNEQNSQ